MLLLDGDRVDRGAHGAGHGQGGGGEEELPHAVGRAVVGEGIEVPQLADEQADVRDADLVQGLEGDVELVRPDLEAPRVGGDAGDLGVVQPGGGGERQPGRRAAGVVAPAAAPGDVPAGAGQPAGAHAHQVAAADPRAGPLRRDGRLEVLGGDGEAVGQLAARPEGAADVEEHAASGEPVGDGLDPGDQVAVAGDDV